MRRRTLAIAGVAAAAAVGGIAWRVRQEALVVLAAPGQMQPDSHSNRESATSLVDTSLWSQTVERVDGNSWSLQSLKGESVIVNFCATWCPPCVREMPLLNRFYLEQSPTADQRRWRLLGLAVDRREAVTRFLTQHPVAYDIGIAGMDAVGWSRRLGNSSGGLPFTVAFDAEGRVLHQKLGEISESELRTWTLPTR
jgi:thiol-disulfide isomerase/thioredoxin